MTSESTSSDPGDNQEVGRPMQRGTPPSTKTTSPDTSQTENDKSSAEQAKTSTLHGRRPGLDQVRVALSQVALRQIEGHGVSDLNSELGGVLMGYAAQDGQQYHVEVKAALPVVTEERGPAHFTFTADAWARLHEDRTDYYPNLEIVGWYHTHPNLGVFFSADDVVVHSAAFVLPWHVGLVYDPIRAEGGLFGWLPESNGAEKLIIAPIDGYYELLDEHANSILPWKTVRSSVWKQGAYWVREAGESDRVYFPDNDWLSLPPISPWWGVILGGLSLLISLLLLLERLLAGGG